MQLDADGRMGVLMQTEGRMGLWMQRATWGAAWGMDSAHVEG